MVFNFNMVRNILALTLRHVSWKVSKLWVNILILEHIGNAQHTTQCHWECHSVTFVIQLFCTNRYTMTFAALFPFFFPIISCSVTFMTLLQFLYSTISCSVIFTTLLQVLFATTHPYSGYIRDTVTVFHCQHHMQGDLYKTATMLCYRHLL